MTPDQEEYKKAMSQIRIVAEWLFGEIKMYFKFVSFKSQMMIGLSVVRKAYFVFGLLQNARTCLYGNKVSEYFNTDPPELEQYFG